MSTTKSRTFDREFKINAVKLYESSGRSIKQLSEELGVSKSAYGRWIQASRAKGGEAFPGKGHLYATDAELTKLRRELSIVRQERDILKKALSIFS